MPHKVDGWRECKVPPSPNSPEARVHPLTSIGTSFFPQDGSCQKENGGGGGGSKFLLCFPGPACATQEEVLRQSLGNRLFPLSLIPWLNNETVLG